MNGYARPLARCLAAGLLVVTATFASSGDAGAQISNCTPAGQSAGNYFDGMYNPQSSFMGVSANIKVRYAAVCDTDQSQYNKQTGAVGNFTSAWSMIADSGGAGWLQSGYLRSYGQALTHFSQFRNAHVYGGMPVTVFGPNVSAGEVHAYWQQFLPDAAGQWHSNVDLNRYINTANGVLTYGWSGYSAQFFGETRYRSSDMPGGSSFPATFTTLQVQANAAVWQPIPSPFLTTANQNPSRWASAPTSATSFDIWTHTYS